MLSSLRSSVAVIAVLAAVLPFTPVLAQTPRQVRRAPPELLAAYVRERQIPDAPQTASLELTHMLTHHNDYPPADVETLLRGLEELALTGSPQWLRAEAVLRLSLPGSNRVARPVPGTFARLERIYRRSSDPRVRSMVVDAMGTVIESREAVAFLERVAAQEPAESGGEAGKAMASLLIQGEEGRRALKRLHETGAVRDLEARRDLATLANNGYRAPGSAANR